jgi:hypothetical protein
MSEIIDVESKLIDEKPIPKVEMLDTADPNIKIKRTYIYEEVNSKMLQEELEGLQTIADRLQGQIDELQSHKLPPTVQEIVDREIEQLNLFKINTLNNLREKQAKWQ